MQRRGPTHPEADVVGPGGNGGKVALGLVGIGVGEVEDVADSRVYGWVKVDLGYGGDNLMTWGGFVSRR